MIDAQQIRLPGQDPPPDRQSSRPDPPAGCAAKRPGRCPGRVAAPPGVGPVEGGVEYRVSIPIEQTDEG